MITIPTSRTLAPGEFSIGAYLRRDIESRKNFIPELGAVRDTDLLPAEFVLGVGVIENLEVTMQIPYVSYQFDAPGELTEPRELGNIRLGTKFRLLDPGDASPVGLALLGSVALPTGNDDFPVAVDRNTLYNEEVGWEILAALDIELIQLPGDTPVTLTMNGGGLFPGHPDEFDVSKQTQPVFSQLRRQNFPNVTLEDAVVQWGAGLDVPLYKDRLGIVNWTTEYRGNTGTIEQIDDYHAVLAGLRYFVRSGFSIHAGIDFGLTNTVDKYSGVVGLAWTGPQPALQPDVRVVTKTEERVIEIEKIVFGDVNFDFDKATLTHLGRGQVYLIAQRLKEGKDVKVEIQGHTDYLGTDEYNKSLGLRRAETVKSELLNLGISPAQISTVSYGEGQPLIDQRTPWARAVNRRTTFIIESEPTRTIRER